MDLLYVCPNDAIITYTKCRHFDKPGAFYHRKSVAGRPQMFKYAPHVPFDLRASV